MHHSSQPSSLGIQTSRRVRVLVPCLGEQDAGWLAWKHLFEGHPKGGRLGLSRLPVDADTQPAQGVCLGVEEERAWLGPVDTHELRSAVLRHAWDVSNGVPLGPLPPMLDSLAWPRPEESAPAPFVENILLMSHAETDLLALEKVAQRLSSTLGPMKGLSLNDPESFRVIDSIAKANPSPRFLVIARVHGRLEAVPGLAALGARARQQGWHFVPISGVDDADPALAHASSVPLSVSALSTAYFMAGGVENLSQALCHLASVCFGDDLSYKPPTVMPAHGLYHHELLLTTCQEFSAHADPARPLALVVFYRAHVLSGNLDFVDAMLRALERKGFRALGVFTSSIRDTDASGMPMALLQAAERPAVVVNTVSYPLLQPGSQKGLSATSDKGPFEQVDAPVLQAIACGCTYEQWLRSTRGLSPSETAVNVALPECDGRIMAGPISFKEQHRYRADEERMARVSGLAQRLVRLRHQANSEKRIAIVLTNSGGKAAKVGGAVALDTPASLWNFLHALKMEGYVVGDLPESPDALMAQLLAKGCYDEKYPLDLDSAFTLRRADYHAWFNAQEAVFRGQMRAAWGDPQQQGFCQAPARWTAADKTTRPSLLALQTEPFSDLARYGFAGLELGHVFIGLQPPRGFGMDPEAIYHAPDLPPTHHYAAFYLWLRSYWKADAMIHFGKHGTLEWLPGKSVALSAGCVPDVLLGDMPLFYPFVVNDPGEGAQAKRRAHAVIIDHLVPPLSQAESYGPLATLSRLVEEYYRAEAIDPAKLPLLQSQLWDLVKESHLDEDLREIRRQRHGNHTHEWDEKPGESGAPRSLEKLSGRDMAHLLEDLDTYLCDLGRAQIRHGLHVFGQAPRDGHLVDMVFAISRASNGHVSSLLDCLDEAGRAETVAGAATQRLKARDALAQELLLLFSRAQFDPNAIEGLIGCLRERLPTHTEPLVATLSFIARDLVPALRRTDEETKFLLHGLSGGYVPAGPSGAPSRGMVEVLPTGRNFYSVDPRGLPTKAAWIVGQGLAKEALDHYLSEAGAFPESIALSVWGTTTMRTGGDDIAQALALLGVKPVWQEDTRRTVGIEIIPLEQLGRPRVDVTLRVSGFFRDAFPGLVQLYDDAVRLVTTLNEPDPLNFVRKHWLAETAKLISEGIEEKQAAREARYRVFSSKPGAYGTGLLELIETQAWTDTSDFARVFLAWGGWAYGSENAEGVAAEASFKRRLSTVDLALHNQDNREHDLFDSDDFFQFHGGLIASISALSGKKPKAYFGDSSNPQSPEVRTLQAEALRVHRTRVVNPKWLEAIRKHGYKGGLEMAATIDYLFGFSATADVVSDWMYEDAAENYTQGESAAFLRRSNPWALNAISERLLEANQRGLWKAKPETVQKLQSVLLESESQLESSAPFKP